MSLALLAARWASKVAPKSSTKTFLLSGFPCRGTGLRDCLPSTLARLLIVIEMPSPGGAARVELGREWLTELGNRGTELLVGAPAQKRAEFKQRAHIQCVRCRTSPSGIQGYLVDTELHARAGVASSGVQEEKAFSRWRRSMDMARFTWWQQR